VNKYNPLHARCRNPLHIELRREIKLKRAVVNVHSTDKACFAWSAVMACIQLKKILDRNLHILTIRQCQIWKILSFRWHLIKLKSLKVETISINVYCIEKQKELSIFPIRLTEKKKMDKHINLLYVQNDNDVGYFAWIKNLSRLVSSQLSEIKKQEILLRSVRIH